MTQENVLSHYLPFPPILSQPSPTQRGSSFSGPLPVLRCPVFQQYPEDTFPLTAFAIAPDFRPQAIAATVLPRLYQPIFSPCCCISFVSAIKSIYVSSSARLSRYPLGCNISSFT